MSWIEGELISGKILIIPLTAYDEVIKYCLSIGMSKKAIKNIHKAKLLTNTTNKEDE